MTDKLLKINPEVSEAKATGRPIVALESTIITHGMPWPQNLQTARQVEEEVRREGAVPATIAVFEGKIHIGLSEDQLKWLAQETDVMKLSRADLAFALSQGKVGSTTVAATMMAAELAEIQVFATGGIGGAHQGAEETFDISADLTELGRTNVITVCAGAKAILDIAKTLEILETKGVPVIAYASDQVPGFWSRESGIPAPLRLNTAEDITRLWQTRQLIGQQGALLVANPVPEAAEIPANQMADFIDQALAGAKEEGVSGKAVTPYLLGKIVEITKGRSLATNIALVRNNARLAARIAKRLA